MILEGILSNPMVNETNPGEVSIEASNMSNGEDLPVEAEPAPDVSLESQVKGMRSELSYLTHQVTHIPYRLVFTEI